MQRFFTQSVLVLLFTAFFGSKANALTTGTASLTSSDGYTVVVTLTPAALVTNVSGCQCGYNYNLKVNYTITYTGTHIPSHLYTLQANIGCGSDMHFVSLPLTGVNSTGTVTTVSNVWRAATDWATATPASLNCTNMKLIINASGINSQTVAMANTVSNPLPIHLSDFSAVADGNKVDVNWTTEVEANVSSYTIQRSTDGNEWVDLGTVASKGNTDATTNYSYTDMAPVAGKNFYRLMETDRNGEVAYYNSALAQFQPTTESVRIYPNPNASNTIHISGLTNEGWSLTVSGVGGQATGTVTVTDGGATLPDMPAGMYFIKLYNSNTQQVLGFKYIKQ